MIRGGQSIENFNKQNFCWKLSLVFTENPTCARSMEEARGRRQRAGFGGGRTIEPLLVGNEAGSTGRERACQNISLFFGEFPSGLCAC
jgi:hypothetical protein